MDVLNYQKQYLLQNPCINCGESDLSVLEFDHNDKVSKFKAVSSLIRARYSLEKMKLVNAKFDALIVTEERQQKNLNGLKIKMPL